MAAAFLHQRSPGKSRFRSSSGIRTSSREAFQADAVSKLAGFPDFSMKVKKSIESIRPIEQWETTKTNRVYDEMIDLTLAKECRLVQLAIYDPETGKVGRTEWGERLKQTGAVSAWVLELHEALYALGFSAEYGHSNPVLTRNLLEAVLTAKANEAVLRNAIEAFTQYRSRKESFLRSSPYGEWVGAWISSQVAVTSGTGLAGESIPEAIVMDYDGLDGLYILVVGHRDGLPWIESFTASESGLKTMNVEIKSSIRTRASIGAFFRDKGTVLRIRKDSRGEARASHREWEFYGRCPRCVDTQIEVLYGNHAKGRLKDFDKTRVTTMMERASRPETSLREVIQSLLPYFD